MTIRIVQPRDWPRPRGYANAVSAIGRQVFVAGQIGWNERGVLVGTDLVSQARRALENIITILAADGARPEHLVRLTWYVLDKQEYLAALREVGAAYREIIGRHYPAMAVVQVSGLVEAEARLEIEATAVIPDPA